MELNQHGLHLESMESCPFFLSSRCPSLTVHLKSSATAVVINGSLPQSVLQNEPPLTELHCLLLESLEDHSQKHRISRCNATKFSERASCDHRQVQYSVPNMGICAPRQGGGMCRLASMDATSEAHWMVHVRRCDFTWFLCHAVTHGTGNHVVN